MRTAPASAALLAALTLSLAAVAAPPAATEPAAPAAPAKYDVTVRYAIDATGNTRATQFAAMLDFFKKLGFTRDEEDAPEDEADNPRYHLLTGTVPSGRARDLLAERHVRALRLLPAGTKLPAAADPVRVELELAGGPLIEPGRHLYGTERLRQEEREGTAMLRRQRLLAAQALAVLRSLGFSEAVGYDNRAHTRLLGSIPAGKLDALLEDLRRQPAAWQLPADPPIDSVLLAGLRRYPGGEDALEAILNAWDANSEGTKLIDKLIAGWRKQPAAVAYLNTLPADVTASTTIVKGLLLAQLVHQPEAAGGLQALWRDALASPAAPDLMAVVLRRLPPAALLDLPLLLRTDSPVRVTDVQQDLPLPRPRPAPPAVAQGQEKLTPELRALLAGGEAKEPRRLEVILALTPNEDDRTWQRDLARAAPASVIEGLVGPLVSVKVPPDQALALAALPIVSTVRLPRSGEPRAVGTAAKLDSAEALRSSGLLRLHSLNHKGQGVRLAVIDGDFSGWQGLVGKTLPARTRLLDLTAERNPDLKPDPMPGGDGLGHGTRMALVAARAAPEADLLLVRIDPAAPYQMLTVARALNGQALHSINLARRSEDLEAFRTDLNDRRVVLVKTREALVQKAPDVSQKPLLLAKKKRLGLTADEEDLLKDIEEYEAYRKEQAKLDADEREYADRMQRYLQLEEALRDLRNVRVVTTGLSWVEGLPVDGGGALTRYFDDEPFRKALWFQAAGDTRGQSWSGLFHDRDGDGVMEFLPPGAAPPPGRWGSSLAFLSWQPAGGAATPDLPQNVRLRVSVQWREPHDPEFLRRGEDAYRKPLAAIRLVLLRQLDPTGTKQPADDFAVVAQTDLSGLPQRLANEAGSAVYEQTVEFTVPAAGRYALRVEGQVPASIRPIDAPTVPAAERTWELRPRVFVETLAGPGRAVLADFATAEGSLGTPADARQAITVGAADGAGKPLPASAAGPVFGMELLRKPAVLSPAVGAGEGPASVTSLSAGFAAGLAASALSAGAPTQKFLPLMGAAPDQVLRVPEDWPKRGYAGR